MALSELRKGQESGGRDRRLNAVFLDKDGTLVRDVPYNVDPSRIEWAPGAADAVRHLTNAGYELIVISNQAGVALGQFNETDLIGIERRLTEMAEKAGGKISGFYWCPHHPEGVIERYRKSCACRKPGAEMIERAARERSLDLSRCWMVGDILHDVEAGRRAGCRPILIDNGNETEWDLSELRVPDYFARDMRDAAIFIMEEDLYGLETQLEKFEEDTLRAIGRHGRRLDDRACDPSDSRIESAGPYLASDFAFGCRGSSADQLDR